MSATNGVRQGPAGCARAATLVLEAQSVYAAISVGAAESSTSATLARRAGRCLGQVHSAVKPFGRSGAPVRASELLLDVETQVWNDVTSAFLIAESIQHLPPSLLSSLDNWYTTKDRDVAFQQILQLSNAANRDAAQRLIKHLLDIFHFAMHQLLRWLETEDSRLHLSQSIMGSDAFRLLLPFAVTLLSSCSQQQAREFLCDPADTLTAFVCKHRSFIEALARDPTSAMASIFG